MPTTYYVSTSGDNSNDGLTSGTAFRDIEYAANYSSLGAGDTINVESGTYYEEILINSRSGSLNNRIKLVAVDGDGTVTVSGLQNSSGTEPYYPRGNFKSGSDSNYASGQALGFVYNGLIRFVGVNHWEITGFNVSKSRGRGLQVHNSSYIRWSNCKLNGSRSSGFHAQNSSYIDLEGSEVTDACNFAPFSRAASELDWPVAVNFKNCTNVKVKRTDIHRCWGEGLSTGRDCNGVEFSDNRIKDCYALLAYIHRSKNVVFERNILLHTNDTTFHRGGDYSRALVFNAEGQFPDSSSPENISIKNNLIIARKVGISFWNNGGGSAQTGYVEVLNNTVVAASGAFAVNSFSNGSTYTDTRVYNNIFYAVDGDAYNTDDSTISQNFTWCNNYWSADPPANMQSGGDVSGTLNLINLTTSYNQNEWPDPLDFRIQSSSPSVSAGANGLYPIADFFGNERDEPIDIGFNQFVSSSGSPPEMTSLGTQYPTEGVAVSVQVEATDPDLDTITYGASNLPDGLSINTSSGLISGTPTGQGTYNSVITAGDGTYTVQQSVVWSVAASAKSITPDFSVSYSGLVATFTNLTTDVGVTTLSYLWDFGDGNTSTDENPEHTYSAAGEYSVTLTATEVASTTNLVSNGDFESGTTDWSEHDGTNTAQLITGADGSGNAYEIESDGGGNTQIYQHSISVTSGDTLTLKFKNKGTTSAGRVKLIKDDSPFTNLGLNETVAFESSWTERELSFTVSTSESDARLQFAYFGSDSGTTIAVDDVELLTASSAPVSESVTNSLTIGIDAVTPNFTLNETSGEPPLTVTVTDTSVLNLEVDIVGIVVDWGDNTSSLIAKLGESASKTYQVAGSYDLVLEVETNE